MDPGIIWYPREINSIIAIVQRQSAMCSQWKISLNCIHKIIKRTSYIYLGTTILVAHQHQFIMATIFDFLCSALCDTDKLIRYTHIITESTRGCITKSSWMSVCDVCIVSNSKINNLIYFQFVSIAPQNDSSILSNDKCFIIDTTAVQSRHHHIYHCYLLDLLI